MLLDCPEEEAESHTEAC